MAKFDETKQIVTDIDKQSHPTTIHNRILQVMNQNGLCKYDTSQQAYLFEHSSKPVNCSNILVFLKQSAWYTVNSETHQWYRINTNKISNNHTFAICNENSINMVPLPPAGPSEFNGFGTVARLSPTQNERDPLTNTHTQTISNNPFIPQNNIANVPRTNAEQTYDESNVILQHFRMIAEELRNFTNKVPGDTTKITQAHNTSQVQTGKLTENAISQALTKHKIPLHQLTQ